MSKISAVYEIACAAQDVERIARDIAIEQTVEVPEELVDDRIREEIVADIAAIDAVADDCFRVRLDYNVELAGGQLPQLINLVFGNVSIKSFVRLVDLALPESVTSVFPGPNLGTEGLRALLGVYERPLLATALKPRGKSLAELASIAGEFALGGGDIVKDDHNLVDGSFETFERRIALCQDTVTSSNAQTGRNCLYLPYVSAPAGELERYVECALRLGVRGILIAPLIVGLDTVRHVAEQYPLLVMSHPTFTGTFYSDPRRGMEAGLLLGTFFRLAGVDVTIFTNHGGRFAFSREQCGSVARRMREPLGTLKPGLPAPAGGMKLERLPDMAEEYGTDAVFLVGGALLGHGENVWEATTAFLDRIWELFSERLKEPQRDRTLR